MLTVRLLSMASFAMMPFVACHQIVLDPISPATTARLASSARLEIRPGTETYTHSLRSFAAGIANKWIIHAGEATGQYAHAYIDPMFASGEDLLIQVALERFDVHDFAAHAHVRIVVLRDSQEVFTQLYHGVGQS